MHTVSPSHLLHLEGSVFLALLAVMIVYRMLVGQIDLGGLFASKAGGVGVSPERVQLLVTTLALSVKYVRDAVHGSGAMPDVSAQWLYVFGASSGVYASVKAFRAWKQN